MYQINIFFRFFFHRSFSQPLFFPKILNFIFSLVFNILLAIKCARFFSFFTICFIEHRHYNMSTVWRQVKEIEQCSFLFCWLRERKKKNKKKKPQPSLTSHPLILQFLGSKMRQIFEKNDRKWLIFNIKSDRRREILYLWYQTLRYVKD